MSSLLRLLLGSFFVAMVVAQIPPNTTAGAVLSMIPDCAASCVTKTWFKDGGCPITNVGEISECTCTNINIQRNFSACIQRSCQIMDQAMSNAFTNVLCDAYPKASRVNELKTTAIVAIVLSVPFLFLRLYSRWLKNGLIFADEAYTVTAALVLVVISILTLRMSLIGFGLHYWNIPPDHGVQLLKLLYVCQLMYVLVQVFAKVAILSLYYRLFGIQSKWFRWFVRGSIAFMFVHGVIYFLLVMFQCVPIEAVWNKLIDGKCLEVNYGIALSGACMSIAEDVIILVLPIPQLWKLQMSLKKKIGIMLLLSVGSFACLTSMIRLKYFLQFATSLDLTWDGVDLQKWSVIEVLTACICGNLMALRPLFDKFIPAIRSVVSSYSRGQHQSCEKIPHGPMDSGHTDGSGALVKMKTSSTSEFTELNEMVQRGSREDDERRLVSR